MLSRYISGQADLPQVLSWLVAVIVAITIHEFAHAKRADQAGDPTPRANGRVTLNPLAHYDPIGSTLFLVFGFGWAKPVPVNPLAFRHPRRDGLLVSLWGPLSNFLTAAVLAMPLRFHLAGDYSELLLFVVLANLTLGVFNLLPISPLDGSHVLEALLSGRALKVYHAFLARNQGLLLILLVLIMVVRPLKNLVFGVIMVPVQLMLELLVGSRLLF